MSAYERADIRLRLMELGNAQDIKNALERFPVDEDADDADAWKRGR